MNRLFRPSLVAAAGLIACLVTGCGGVSTQPSSPPTTATGVTPYGPTALDEKGLRSAVRSIGGNTLFWAGPEAGRSYELKRIANGEMFLRYLPAGVKAGDRRAFRTIGTYPFRNAYTAGVALSKRSGWTTLESTRWLAVYRNARPTNIYLSEKGLPAQIEVFDPSAAQARALVRTGRVVPLG